MTIFQTIFVPLCVAVAFVVLARTLRGAGSRKNGLLWALMWLGAATFIAIPRSTTTLAGWLGIGRGADLILYIATLGGLGASLYFYSRFRKLEVLVTGLAAPRGAELAAPRRLEVARRVTLLTEPVRAIAGSECLHLRLVPSASPRSPASHRRD